MELRKFIATTIREYLNEQIDNEDTITAGNVLTKSLLNKIDKAAYQYGGFKTIGGIKKKTPQNLDAKTVVAIPEVYLKTTKDKFIEEFQKTMNAYYYQIEFI